MSEILIRQLPNTIALGEVATGIINAQEAEIVAGIISNRGLVSITTTTVTSSISSGNYWDKYKTFKFLLKGFIHIMGFQKAIMGIYMKINADDLQFHIYWDTILQDQRISVSIKLIIARILG